MQQATLTHSEDRASVQNDLFERIKRAVREVDAEAQVFLYGSRARGDYAHDSDWDFLILFSKPVNRQQKAQLRRALYDIELETGEILSTVFDDLTHWASERNRFSPFYKNVTRDSISL